ncbi:MAG: carboxypeptidase-like regulatory domain-containing protein [Nanoarchaeota archaeon]|nr:carboxypeptidase-like regulatory domain-containing protein [Nanoarchaeota archaeon]
MNKRAILISFIALLIVLFSPLTTYSVNYGTCFDSSVGTCYYMDIDQPGVSCPVEQGYIFYSGMQPNSVVDCQIGCCCAAALSGNEVYPVRRGVCESTYNSNFLAVDEATCVSTCELVSPTTPLCGASCSEITQKCVGKSVLVNLGDYYCWENNRTYGSTGQSLCQSECLPVQSCALNTQISSDCYCGGNLYSSGFCCFDNSYSTDGTDTGCPSANECEMYLDTDKSPSFFKCCDSCLDASEYGIWAGGIDSCRITYGEGVRDNCCTECAPDLIDCCDYADQCPSEKILIYDYVSCVGKTPCNASCAEPICVLGEIINGGSNSDYGVCECAGDYYDTSSNSNYCCAGGLSSVSCQSSTFNLSGYVYSIERRIKIPNANIRVITLQNEYTTTTGADGTYFIQDIEMGNGKFNVFVLKEGYHPGKYEIEYPPNPITKPEDFNIIPVSGACDGINPPKVSVFTASPIKGVKAVNLEWANPCEIAPEKVVAYSIWRNDGFYLGRFFTNSNSFVDYNVSWSDYNDMGVSDIKNYNYSIMAYYISGANSSKTNVSMTMGHKYCEGILDGDEFCLNSVLTKTVDFVRRYTCDSTNNIVKEGDCNLPYTCVGPDTQGLTQCKLKTNCYDGGNPFGLFYDSGNCLGVSNRNYCYYDYSETSIDNCMNCSTLDDCYDYNSESACLADNCLIAGANSFGVNNLCQWTYTYEEFGKGICYDPDYSGGDHCDLCNKDSGLFYTSNCYQNICSKLGSCYSDDASCEQCTNNMRCETYDNEASCVNADSSGARNSSIVDVNGCHVGVIKSNDACGLGTCKWGDPLDGVAGNIGCFKDANDDKIPDCSFGEELCKEDSEPFITVPQKDIPIMNAQGNGITFYLTEGGMGEALSFFFCVDKDNLCCPITPKSINEPTTLPNVVINPISDAPIIFEFDEVGTYFIRYYSIDSNKNIEEVKSTEFFVDPIAPTMNFGDYNYNTLTHNYTLIVASSTEYVKCQYNLNNIPGPSDTNFDTINNTFFIRFQDLDDGGYVFTTVCNDTAGNSLRTDYPFYIDGVHDIIIHHPTHEILNDQNVKFSLTTLDNATCTLQAVDSTVNGIPYNELPGGIVLMDSVKTPEDTFNYTKTLDLQKDVSYIVKAVCTRATGSDNDYFLFTIDKASPVTSTSFDFNAWHKLDPSTGLVTIDFNCIDPNINGTPGESGCSKFHLCEDLNCYRIPGTPYQISGLWSYPTAVDDRRISYFSEDGIGNKELSTAHIDKRIKIDGSEPTISIVLPTNNFASARDQLIRVTADDTPSGIDHVEIKLRGIDVLKINISNATRYGDSATYNLNVQLYNGQNEIIATAFDQALNYRYVTKDIYLDVYAPEIGQMSIFSSGVDDNPLNDVYEYRENLSFDVQIKDEVTVIGNLRQGVGVDNSKVKLMIFDSSNNLMNWTMMKTGENDHYYNNVTKQLPVGRYNATLEAYDQFSNYANKSFEFEVKDTIPADFVLKVKDLSGIVLFDSSPGGVKQALNAGTYNLTIECSEDVMFTLLNYTFDSDYGVQKILVPLSTLDNKLFNGTLKIPDDSLLIDYYLGEHDARFNIKIQESADVVRIDEVLFTIGVVGPNSPVLYLPYPDKLEVYGTSLKVTGDTNAEPELNVYLYRDSSSYNQVEYSTTSYGEPTLNPALGGMDPKIREAPPQKQGTYMPGEKDLYIQGYSWFNIFRVDNGNPYKYVQLGTQNQFYEVNYTLQTRIQGLEYTKVALKTGLDSMVSIDTSIKSYSQSHPAGYFELNVDDIEVGENDFTAISVSNAGVAGESSLVYTVVHKLNFTLKVYDSSKHLVFDSSSGGIKQSLNAGTYNITINCSEPVDGVLLNYTFKSYDINISLSSGDRQFYNGNLTIPTPPLTVLDYMGQNPAQFKVSLQDLGEIVKYSEISFNIDVGGPIAPTLYIPNRPPNSDYTQPKIVYHNTTLIEGTTNSGGPLTVSLFIDNSGDCSATCNKQTSSAPYPELNPLLGENLLTVRRRADSDITQFQIGEFEPQIYILGDFRGKVDSTYKYVGFGTSPEQYYKIKNPSYTSTLCYGIACTALKLEGYLKEDIDVGSYLGIYDSNVSGGYFSFEVNVTPGDNYLSARAYSIEGIPGAQSDVYTVSYDNSPINITQISPTYGQTLYYTDVYTGSQPHITINIETEIDAKCNITNSGGSKIAKSFSYVMQSGDNRHHAFVLDSGYCAPGGKFCYINDDANSGIIYHNHTINCEAVGRDIPAETKTICFGAATYSSLRPGSNNICSAGVSSCSGQFPTDCSGGDIPNCIVGSPITQNCLCMGIEYPSGYCCSGGYSASECITGGDCPQGQISSGCNCGGSIYTSGYCCSGVYSSSPCPTSGVCSQGQISGSCDCGGSTYTSGYCCWGYYSSTASCCPETIISSCLCDGQIRDIGYCCAGIYRTTQCSTQGTWVR